MVQAEQEERKMDAQVKGLPRFQSFLRSAHPVHSAPTIDRLRGLFQSQSQKTTGAERTTRQDIQKRLTGVEN
jgi:hypothetical protein